MNTKEKSHKSVICETFLLWAYLSSLLAEREGTSRLFYRTIIDFIHLFNTRKDTFSKDNVLQETLINYF